MCWLMGAWAQGHTGVVLRVVVAVQSPVHITVTGDWLRKHSSVFWCAGCCWVLSIHWKVLSRAKSPQAVHSLPLRLVESRCSYMLPQHLVGWLVRWFVGCDMICRPSSCPCYKQSIFMHRQQALTSATRINQSTNSSVVQLAASACATAAASSTACR